MNNENGIFNLIYNNMGLVYNALIQSLKASPNFEIVSEEPAVHLVHVTVGKSLFSQGDELNISLVAIDDNKTKIQFSSNIKVGIVDNIRAKYGDTIQKLIDKMNAILPPPVMEAAPQPNNMVQVGELTKQMDMQANSGHAATIESPSINQVLNQGNVINDGNNQNNSQSVSNDVPNNSESNYAYEPKPFDYESLKENESSKHKDNDPLKDLMRNL